MPNGSKKSSRYCIHGAHHFHGSSLQISLLKSGAHCAKSSSTWHRRHPLLRRHLKLMKQGIWKKSYNCCMATAPMYLCVYWSAVTQELWKSQEVNPNPTIPAHSFKKYISFFSYVMSQHTSPKWCVQTNSCQIAWGDSNLTYLVHPSHSSHRSTQMSTLIRLNQDCETLQVCRSKMV